MSSSQGMAYPVAGVLEYLHNALDAVDALVVVYDADETLVACNRRCREVFAEAANLFTPGRSLTEILHGYYRAGGKLVPPGMSEEAYVAASLERLRDMAPVRPVVRWGARWMRLARYRTSDAGVICLAYDVTEEQEVEQQLRESEERFRSLTELSSDWYWEQDKELRFTYFSKDTNSRSGYSQHKALGNRRWELPSMRPLSATW